MIDLLNLTKPQLREWVASLGEAAYRATQIERWVYHNFVFDLQLMTDLPESTRTVFGRVARVGVPSVLAETSSADGLTRKVLLGLEDGQTVETVLMLYPDAPGGPQLEEPRNAPSGFLRRTVCISTQVGCPIGCPFCATGQAGYVRNLTPGEIVAQVLRMEEADAPVTHVVVMGMGEPFMKFDVTWQAVQSLVDAERVGLGARRITISTSGEIPGIERMSREGLQVNLAVSLHAPNDELRNVLVPLNRKYPLKDLMHAVRAYVRETHRRVTFEYALMEDINDRPDQARALAHMLSGLICHVNLIPLNPTTESAYHRPDYSRVKEFERILRLSGIPTTLRVEKGIEIAAGCGQLRQIAAEPSRSPVRI